MQSERGALYDRFLGALKREHPDVAKEYEANRNAKRRRIEADNRLAAMFKSVQPVLPAPGPSAAVADAGAGGQEAGPTETEHLGSAGADAGAAAGAAEVSPVTGRALAASPAAPAPGGFSFAFNLG